MTTATLTARRNQNLYRQPATLQLGPTSAMFVVIALISVLALLYLNQITKTNAFSYQLTDLTNQQNTLMADKDQLEVEAGRLQAIATIQSSSVASKMVPTGQVSYAK
ncbi:MAG TPA: hypothetical protein VMS08_04055 [Candidatus Saccharimonadia bacterium]|nr:hypothetical protein [Candidatus Saccharimonadia bacterium]